MRDAGGWQTSISKEARGHKFGEIRAVLTRIIQEELAQAAVGLAGDELVESHRKARFFVQRAKAAHAFEVDGDVSEGVCSLSEGPAHVLPIFFLQRFELRTGNLNFECPNGAI